jgi:hypothetical protein
MLIKICCTPEPPDINSLTMQEKRRFGLLVHRLRKSGHDLKTAQERAYQRVLLESVDGVDW